MLSGESADLAQFPDQSGTLAKLEAVAVPYRCDEQSAAPLADALALSTSEAELAQEGTSTLDEHRLMETLKNNHQNTYRGPQFFIYIDIELCKYMILNCVSKNNNVMGNNIHVRQVCRAGAAAPAGVTSDLPRRWQKPGRCPSVKARSLNRRLYFGAN